MAKNYLMSISLKIENAGVPVTTDQTIRISAWQRAWHEIGDIVDGVINIESIHYSGYQSVKNFTPDSDGQINLALGEFSNFPQLTPNNQFFMIEFKNVGDPDTSYQVYKNSYIDGTYLDHIPLIENGIDIFHAMTQIIGTSNPVFTINREDLGGDTEVVFGKTLNEKLYWDDSEGRFTFTDDLLVDDGFRVNTDYLTVNGTTGFVGIGTTTPDTNLHINGGISINRTAVSDVNYTVLPDDYLVAYASLTAERTLSLNDSLCTEGRLFVIKDETGNASVANSIVIDPEGVTTIDGASTKEIELGYRSVQVYCDGSVWHTY